MKATYLWKNGKLCGWESAQIHVMSHALHYGSSVFEGLRSYDVAGCPAIFQGVQHFERLIYSCRVARIPSPLTIDEWMQASMETLQANKHRAAYIRPLVFRGLGESMGLDGRKCPVEAIVCTIPWGNYYGEELLEQGIDVHVSSWRRTGANALCTMAKIGGHYVTPQNIIMEAHDNGFHEGIALDADGCVTEASGQNVFMAIKGKLLTPVVGSGVIDGITRRCTLQIADELGIEVVETSPSRDMLYLADEIFLTGTASEICPVRSIDRIPVGNGKPGAMTRSIQDVFFSVVQGRRPDTWNWLSPVKFRERLDPSSGRDTRTK